MIMKKLRVLALALIAAMAGGSARATPSDAEIDRSLEIFARALNRSVAAAPPQTTFIQFEVAVARPGKQFYMIHRIPSIPSAPQGLQDPRGEAEMDTLFKSIVSRTLCQEWHVRKMMGDGVKMTAVFLAANKEPLHTTKMVESDCSQYPIPREPR